MKKSGLVSLLIFSSVFMGCDAVEFSKEGQRSSEEGRAGDLEIAKDLDIEAIRGLIYRQEVLGTNNVAPSEISQFSLSLTPDSELRFQWGFERQSRHPDGGFMNCVTGAGYLYGSQVKSALAQIKISTSRVDQRSSESYTLVRDVISLVFWDGSQLTVILDTSDLIKAGEPIGSGSDELVSLFNVQAAQFPSCAYSI